MLKLKQVGIDTYRDNIAFIARNCTVYRPEEYQALKKIEVKHDGGKILASLMIVDDETIVARDELGLSEQAFRRLGLAEGVEVTLTPAVPPISLDHVRSKIHGHNLDATQIDAIIADIAAHRYSEMEIAAFLVSSAGFMTTDELLAMTNSMARVGNRLHWDAPIVVDKHCIGGIPGNRTSMVVVPIVAAHGLPMPKSSSRAITSPAGTADTMEVLAKVDLSTNEMRDVVEACNGCLVWGGHVNLSPADDILIAVERPLAIDTREQMVASILSKKLAAGSSHLLVDVPVGPTAKVRSHNEALRLRKLFEYVGDATGLNLQVVLSDGNQPIGRGIGPVLEARDVMSVLRCEPGAPQDLREKSIEMAGYVLDFDPNLRGGKGRERAQELLDSGAALATMNKIIDAQGRKTVEPCLGELVWDVCAPNDGVVERIDCFRIARIARLAGAPMDAGAGINLWKKVGETVEKDEPLYRIHACFQSDFRFATSMAREMSGYQVMTL